MTTLVYAILFLVVVLLFEGVRVEIVAPIALVGLVLFWLAGWRRATELYRHFLNDELEKLEREEEQEILKEHFKGRGEEES